MFIFHLQIVLAIMVPNSYVPTKVPILIRVLENGSIICIQLHLPIQSNT